MDIHFGIVELVLFALMGFVIGPLSVGFVRINSYALRFYRSFSSSFSSSYLVLLQIDFDANEPEQKLFGKAQIRSKSIFLFFICWSRNCNSDVPAVLGEIHGPCTHSCTF
jgi:hypothetical protein